MTYPSEIRIVIHAEANNDAVVEDAINALEILLNYMMDNVVVTSEKTWQASLVSTPSP